MSKELEALELISNYANDSHHFGEYEIEYRLVLKALQRLETINNTKPSEALIYLNKIGNSNYFFGSPSIVDKAAFNIIEQALKRLEAIENSNSNDALKSLEDLKNMCETKIPIECFPEYHIIKQALLKLETINNVSHSEALDCLNKIDNTLRINWNKGYLRVNIDIYNYSDCSNYREITNCLHTIKQALIQSENDKIKSVKDKRFREIVVSKNVDMSLLKDSDKVEDYNFSYTKVYGREEEFKLTEEEFNFVKEVKK